MDTTLISLAAIAISVITLLLAGRLAVGLRRLRAENTRLWEAADRDDWEVRAPTVPNAPRFQKRSLVEHHGSIRMQVLKIRQTESGGYEYKIRHYNSLVGAYWAPERELHPNMV